MTTAVQKAPRITLHDAELLAADLYGLDVSEAPLPSERDQNFALRNASGEQFVLKIANPEESLEFLDLQNQLIQFLAVRDLDLQFTYIALTKPGKAIETIKDDNDYNILVSQRREQRVNAILDYGDVVHTATVCDLAIALAYVMLDKPDPIGVAAQVVSAYHETYPLDDTEVEVLYTLAATRLCCSVCFAARQTHEAPDNEYLNISNAPAWRLLEKLSNISLDWPTRIFRYACGLPVVNGQGSTQSQTSVELLSGRRRHLGQSLSVSYESLLHIVCGS